MAVKDGAWSPPYRSLLKTTRALHAVLNIDKHDMSPTSVCMTSTPYLLFFTDMNEECHALDKKQLLNDYIVQIRQTNMNNNINSNNNNNSSSMTT